MILAVATHPVPPHARSSSRNIDFRTYQIIVELLVYANREAFNVLVLPDKLSGLRITDILHLSPPLSKPHPLHTPQSPHERNHGGRNEGVIWSGLFENVTSTSDQAMQVMSSIC
jgi:hypothetical protein